MRDDVESTPEGSDGEYSLDPEDQLPEEDTLIDRGVDDLLDEGYSPPERSDTTAHYGLTQREQRAGETITQYVAEEEPDPAAQTTFHVVDEDSDRDWRSNEADSDPEFPQDDEVGRSRSGRLLDPEDGDLEHHRQERVADNVGIDGGAAGAEEAAVHVIDDDV